MNILARPTFFYLNRAAWQSLALYVGFVNFILSWPVASIVIKNDSFRVVGGWSWQSYWLFLLFFLAVPVVVVWSIERLLCTRNPFYGSRFRYFLFFGGGIMFFTQFVEYHLNPFLKGAYFLGNGERHLLLFAGYLAMTIIILFFRKFFSSFFAILSVATLFTAGFLAFQTFELKALPQEAFNQTTDAYPRLNIPVYLLVFDGVSLQRLLEKDQINKALFPTFATLSKEWTWYRNATTNATSTIPARSMMFSGRYLEKKRTGLFGYSDNLLETARRIFPVSSFINDNSASDAFARISQMSLMKALAEAYLEVSAPSPMRPYLLSVFSSWKFDWRGDAPEKCTGRENECYGTRMQSIFEDFSHFASDPAQARGGFFVLWSMLSHFPYIFNQDGTIHDSSDVSFEVGMTGAQKLLVEKSYTKALQNTDRLLGIFLKRLRESGLYNQAIILITSDHGMSDTGNNAHVDEQVASIPFFIKISSLPSGPNDRDVQTIDITPTVLDAVGALPSSSLYDGQSLLDPYESREKVMFGLGTTGRWILDNNRLWVYKK